MDERLVQYGCGPGCRSSLTLNAHVVVVCIRSSLTVCTERSGQSSQHFLPLWTFNHIPLWES